MSKRSIKRVSDNIKTSSAKAGENHQEMPHPQITDEMKRYLSFCHTHAHTDEKENMA